MRLAAQAKGGFYPTPPRVVDLIAELIHTPSGSYNLGRETLRILDPCCGAGEALAQLAEGPGQAQRHPHRDLRRRAAPGPGAGGRGAAGPRPGLGPVRHVHSERGLRAALVESAIRITTRRTSARSTPSSTHTTRYLADGGLLVFIVPRQRLAVSARYLSTH